MMAGFFKKLSGIDPFTIDQLQHQEHSDSVYESTIAKWARQTDIELFSSSILTHKKTGNLIQKEVYDVGIIANPTIMINGRPHWLSNLNDRHKLIADTVEYQLIESIFFMVQAIYKNEDLEMAVPADQFAYQKGRKNVSLF